MISFSFFIVDVLNNRRGLCMVLNVRVPTLALSGSKQTGKPLCRQSPARAGETGITQSTALKLLRIRYPIGVGHDM